MLVLPVPKILGFVILMLGVIPTMSYALITGQRMGSLIAIEAYEEHSGKKVIPEKYRARIVKGWTRGPEEKAP